MRRFVFYHFYLALPLFQRKLFEAVMGYKLLCCEGGALFFEFICFSFLIYLNKVFFKVALEKLVILFMYVRILLYILFRFEWRICLEFSELSLINQQLFFKSCVKPLAEIPK